MTTKENREMFAKAETPVGSARMETKQYNLNAMGEKPMSGDSREGGNNSRGPLGEVRPAGIVAEGRFGGSRDSATMARKTTGGRKMSGGRGR